MADLQAPFPWFGGKRRVAPIVWERFGAVANYVEPFFGSGAVLLGRPDWTPGMTETVNDLDGYLANFWRAVQADPEAAAHYADWPVNENDLHGRHAWLLRQRDTFVPRLEGDPDFYDAKIAGWWVWGMCAWIGTGFCAGNGPWVVEDAKLVNGKRGGVWRNRPHLGNRGRGINRQRPHLGNRGQAILEWFEALSVRLHDVRVCCGDWSRVCGPTPTTKLGLTAVFLDPPYALECRDADIYREDSMDVAHAVREWAIGHGDNPLMRIALCGYEGEHDMPDGWECVAWKAHGGYGSQGEGLGRENAHKERIWFSQACIQAAGSPQMALGL